MSNSKGDLGSGYPGQKRGSDGAHTAQDPWDLSQHMYPYAQLPSPRLPESSNLGRELNTQEYGVRLTWES